MDGRSKLHPAVQAPAMPRAVVHAYAFSLLALGEFFVAMLLMTCFYGVLGISEALGLRRSQPLLRPVGSHLLFGLYQARRGRGGCCRESYLPQVIPCLPQVCADLKPR